jgi:hypothetical protein
MQPNNCKNLPLLTHINRDKGNNRGVAQAIALGRWWHEKRAQTVR